MMVALTLIAPLLLAVAPLAQDGEHARLAAEFVSVLPPDDEKAPSEPVLDEAATGELARLAAEYPAKEAQIRAILLDRVRCSDAAADRTTADMMRETALSLTDAELRSLIAFYSGADYVRFRGAEEGDAVFQEIMARYPLSRFVEAMQAQTGNLFEAVFANEQACDAARDAALAGIGVQP